MSRVRGAGRVRSMLRRIEPELRAEIATAMQAAGRTLVGSMQAEAPFKTGLIKRTLASKFYAKSLRLRVGIVGKVASRKAFYAGILEFGRGIRKKVDKRGRRIGRIEPGRYIFGPRTDVRRALGARINGVFKRAIDRAAAGAGNAD